MPHHYVSMGCVVSRIATACAVVVCLSACQVISALWHDLGPSHRLGEQRFEMEPIVSDRFTLPITSNVVGEIQVLQVSHEDTLYEIARRYDLGIDELSEANPGVDRWLPGQGTVVVLPTRFVLPAAPRKGIVLNIASKRLFYYPHGRLRGAPIVITHPVGVGRVDWSTPTGSTNVIAKAKDPSWYVPKSVRVEHAAMGDPLPSVVPPGPENPLGKFVLSLGMAGYLIHGTNKPAGVGMRVSHGCIRLYPEDIKPLYETVPIGASVTIVNQPYLVGWSGKKLYVEAHAPAEDDQTDRAAALRTDLVKIARMGGQSEDSVDWKKVERVIRDAIGFPVPVTRGSPDTKTLVLSARAIRRQPLKGMSPDREVDQDESSRGAGAEPTKIVGKVYATDISARP